jgi:hypothetical protein
MLQLTDATTKTYTIQNVLVVSDYETANRIARTFYGADAIAVDVSHYSVGIGCTYTSGVFYDTSGNVVSRNQSEEEVRIAELEAKNTELEMKIAMQNEAMNELFTVILPELFPVME